MQARSSNRFPCDIFSVQIGLNRPPRQSCNAATAGNELEDGDGQFGSSSCGIYAGGSENITDQVETLIGNRVRYEYLVLEVPRCEIWPARKRMAWESSARTS